ncbi:MAG: ABC-2 transporter permease [bacterium]
MRSFIALLRRELWEHTSLWKVPAGLLLLIFLANLAVIFWASDIGLYVMTDNQTYGVSEILKSYEEQSQDQVNTEASSAIKGIMIGIGVVVRSIIQILIIFYVLESLFKERKDRSILFWKSLPISDTEIVLSKLVTAILVVPILSYFTVAVGQLMTLLMQGFMMSDVDGLMGMMWDHAQLPHLWNGYFFLRIEQALWFFPVLGYMLFCSAIARKSPFTLAILLPLLVMFIDSAFRLDTGISETLLNRSPIVVPEVSGVMTGNETMDTTDVEGLKLVVDKFVLKGFSELFKFMGNVEVLAGLGVGVLFVLATIWVRRRQGEETLSLSLNRGK